MKIKSLVIVISLIMITTSISWSKGMLNLDKVEEVENRVVNVYTSRHYDVDKELYKMFTAKTGIKVNVISGTDDELIERLSLEGEASNMDLLFLSEISKVTRAKNRGLLSDISKITQNERVVERVRTLYRDIDDTWMAITMRSRVIVYDKRNDFPTVEKKKGKNNETIRIQTYEQLGDPTGPTILMRTSHHPYNISLISFMLERLDTDKTSLWIRRMSGMFARSPEGNDRDQMKAIIAGIGEVSVVNSYYVGAMMHSRVESDRTVGNRMAIIQPNPTQINVSAVGIAKNATNRIEAERLILFLISKEAQTKFTNDNFEYPVVFDVEASKLLQSWGKINISKDIDDLNVYESHTEVATRIADENGWQ